VQMYNTQIGAAELAARLRVYLVIQQSSSRPPESIIDGQCQIGVPFVYLCRASDVEFEAVGERSPAEHYLGSL